MEEKKPNTLRSLPYEYLPAKIIDVEALLLLLGFSFAQRQAFFTANEAKLASVSDWIVQDGHHFLTYYDENYPRLLKQISSAPISLFVQGELENLGRLQLAVVGSRNYTAYGQRCAWRFSEDIASTGVVITSGLALGIDSISHRATLACGGRTVAVLGSGLSQITPRTHCRLAQSILDQQGTLVSEFLPTTPALPAHFPRRNRIISGLSQAVLVVEAAAKSGSLITAKLALEQDRDIFALPGSIESAFSEGTNWLIQQGAYLVTSPQEIIEQLQAGLHWLLPQRVFTAVATTALPISVKIDDKALPYPEILATISYQPISADQIADLVAQPIPDVMIKLLELELSGAISVVMGGYIRC